MIGPNGDQMGILDTRDALAAAQEAKLDLVEVAPSASPPVCKIIDYGKFRYDQTKREKESKKFQHQVKVKEIKVKPNIDEHDFETKRKRAYQFLEKGNKVKVTCMFRGREMAYPDRGKEVIRRMCEGLEEVGQVESLPKMMGRSMTAVLAPSTSGKAKKKPKEPSDAQNENK